MEQTKRDDGSQRHGETAAELPNRTKRGLRELVSTKAAAARKEMHTHTSHLHTVIAAPPRPPQMQAHWREEPQTVVLQRDALASSDAQDHCRHWPAKQQCSSTATACASASRSQAPCWWHRTSEFHFDARAFLQRCQRISRPKRRNVILHSDRHGLASLQDRLSCKRGRGL